MKDIKDLLASFLLDYLGETAAKDYFPSMSGEEWRDSIPDECVQRFEESLNALGKLDV